MKDEFSGVSVLLPGMLLLVAVGFGLQSTDTPLGKPETASVTLPVKPYSGLMKMEELPELPCPISIEPNAESEKVGA